MNIELARRALACKHWRWMPGMRQFAGRNFAPYRIVSDIYAPPEGEAIMDSYDGDNLLPDLTDPATLGCLLSLVREAWGDDTIYASNLKGYDGYDWVCIVDTGILTTGNARAYLHTKHGVTYFCGLTEAEALVAALEAAP